MNNAEYAHLIAMLKKQMDKENYFYNATGTTGNITTTKTRKKMPKYPTREALKKRKIVDRDRTWLTKIYLDRDISGIPQTTFLKLWAKGLLKIQLTEEGQKQGFISALIRKGEQ